MSQGVYVHLLPSLFDPGELSGTIAVVIDVLRASTTITHALAAGAKGVQPCGDMDEARQIAQSRPAGTCLLGGERNGRRIDGFDLDNSPLSYTAGVVDGKQIVFTTTNGTRALLRAATAERVLLGCFVNLQAVVRTVLADQRPVHLICAGTNGEVSAEDCLCAGALAVEIRAAAGRGRHDDETELVVGYYESTLRIGGELFTSLSESRGGRNLSDLGYVEDIRRSACRDLFGLVPEYFRNAGQIRTAESGGPKAA